jgi:hypothetical protein
MARQRALFGQGEATEWALMVGVWAPPRMDNATDATAQQLREGMIVSYWRQRRLTTFVGFSTIDANGNTVPPPMNPNAEHLAFMRQHVQNMINSNPSETPVGGLGFDLQQALALPVAQGAPVHPPAGGVGNLGQAHVNQQDQVPLGNQGQMPPNQNQVPLGHQQQADPVNTGAQNQTAENMGQNPIPDNDQDPRFPRRDGNTSGAGGDPSVGT